MNVKYFLFFLQIIFLLIGKNGINGFAPTNNIYLCGTTVPPVLGIYNNIAQCECEITTINKLIIDNCVDIPANFEGKLEFNSDNITEIQDDAFIRLTKLNSLVLNTNFLTNFNKNVFSTLDTLKSLVLLVNNIQTLPTAIFHNLILLEVLIIQNSKLEVLPDNILNYLTNIETIDLKNNSLTTLASSTFNNLTKLSVLILSENPWNCSNCNLNEIGLLPSLQTDEINKAQCDGNGIELKNYSLFYCLPSTTQTTTITTSRTTTSTTSRTTTSTTSQTTTFTTTSTTSWTTSSSTTITTNPTTTATTTATTTTTTTPPPVIFTVPVIIGIVCGGIVLVAGLGYLVQIFVLKITIKIEYLLTITTPADS